MKRKLTHIAGIIGLAIGAIASPTAFAQTTAPGPYYATPSWDQTLACPTPTSCPRFIVLSNMNSDAVLDRETGLVWEKSPSSTPLPWEDPNAPVNAATHCNQLKVGNRAGWRLPTVQELATLIDFDPANTSAPRLPPGNPFTNVPDMFSQYWSATTVNTAFPFAWTVFFGNAGGAGPQVTANGKGQKSFVWCVRGGQGVDPQ